MLSAKNLLLICLSSLLIVSCGPKELKIKSEPIKRLELNIQKPEPVRTKLVQWIVITPENATEVFQKMKDENYSLVLFGLTDDGYQNLSGNIAEVRKYIIEQSAIINAYKEYYEPQKEKE